MRDKTIGSDETTAPQAQYLPIDVDPIDMAFGGKAMQILPPYEAIPQEFQNLSNQWVKWQAQWFYQGLARYPVPRDGIDMHKAMANLQCAQRSFEPKHEHKAAGVAYLASLWFTSPDGEPLRAEEGEASA